MPNDDLVVQRMSPCDKPAAVTDQPRLIKLLLPAILADHISTVLPITAKPGRVLSFKTSELATTPSLLFIL